MHRVLTIGVILLSLTGSVLATSGLNDCFTSYGGFISSQDGTWKPYAGIDYLYYYSDYYQNIPYEYFPERYWPGTYIEFERLGPKALKLKGNITLTTMYNTGGHGETLFMKMAKGSVVSKSSFEGAPRVFQHVGPPYSSQVTSDYDINVRTDSYNRKTIYLGFKTFSIYSNDDVAIGWIALEVDTTSTYGDVYVVGSAIDLDGGPVTVGSSLALDPLPEPDVPEDYSLLLEGGVRQTNIFVDASVAVSGDGCSWASPFKTIQEGVDAVRLDGTVVHVKPGIYEPVQVDNRKFTLNGLTHTFTVESTDGPHATIIRGGAISASLNGCVATTRSCFWYGEDSKDLYDVVRGFTLCNATHGGQDGRFENCIVSNCWFGLYGATAVNCILVDNFRAGAGGGEMYNCVSTRNGYGMTSTMAYNSIVEGNLVTNRTTDNCSCCCSTPLPLRGTGNITNAPLFVSAETGDFRLRAGSPCIDAGSDEFCQSDTDLAGNRRVQGVRVDMGCYEYGAGTNGTTVTTPVAVPHKWLEQYAAVPLNAAEEDYEAAAMRESGKKGSTGMPVTLWQEYVQGTVPSDSNDCFQASISLEGEIGISFTPCRPDRRYTLYGSWSLDGPWVSTMDFDNVEFIRTNRFFKVGVELR